MLVIHLSTLLRCTDELQGGGPEQTSVTNQSPSTCGYLRLTSPSFPSIILPHGCTGGYISSPVLLPLLLISFKIPPSFCFISLFSFFHLLPFTPHISDAFLLLSANFAHVVSQVRLLQSGPYRWDLFG